MSRKRLRYFKAYAEPSGDWYLLPSVHYEHWGDPILISLNFLCFTLSYHSVVRYTVKEFKEMIDGNKEMA